MNAAEVIAANARIADAADGPPDEIGPRRREAIAANLDIQRHEE